MARAPSQNIPNKSPTEEVGFAGVRMNAGKVDDEFLPDLRGARGRRRYREMRDNDPIIGAFLYAIEMVLRRAEWRFDPTDESEEARAEADFANEVFFDGMEVPWDEFMSQALSFLPYGFSLHELVMLRRADGFFGVRKLAYRPQTTIERWVYDDKGNLLGAVQKDPRTNRDIPLSSERLLHLRLSTATNSPEGRSILRNAYRPYYYATHIENIEAIAIERELNGVPVIRIPSQYLTADSGPEVQIREEYLRVARDLKMNEQGSLVIPSDTYRNADGSLTNIPKVQVSLIASEGNRAIDTSKTIVRYRQDMARTVLADFVMLGAGERGSFALSKSKTDLFLTALQGHAELIASAINRQILPKLWVVNGKNPDLMPSLVAANVAPVDLEEIGTFVRDVSGAGFPVFPDEQIEAALLDAAGLPSDHREDSDLLGSDDDTEGDLSGDEG